LERELDWDFAEFVKDTLYVPIDLSLPENHYSKGGHAFLQNRVWLQAVKISGTDDYYFKMLTAFPDSSRNTDKFNGLIVYEDYFVGSKKTLAFENSVRSNKRIVSATKKHSSESLSKASALDCYDVQVGTVCVGDPTNPEAPDKCYPVLETLCDQSDGGSGPPNPGGFPGGDPGGLPPGLGGGGGSVNDPGGAKKKLIEGSSNSDCDA